MQPVVYNDHSTYYETNYGPNSAHNTTTNNHHVATDNIDDDDFANDDDNDNNIDDDNFANNDDNFADNDDNDDNADFASNENFDFMSAFKSKYSSMVGKWTLNCTGRIVEDVIYAGCLQMDEETFNQSLDRLFVIDLSVENAGFTADEWEEIEAEVLPLPTPSHKFIESLKRFNNVCSSLPAI